MKLVTTASHRVARILALSLVAGATTAAAAFPIQDAPTTAPAKDLPKAEKILKSARQAMGGEKAIDKIESLMTKSEAVTPQGNMAIEAYWAKPDLMYVKQSFGEMGAMVQGHDGTVGWRQNPMTGGYELIDAEGVEGMQGQASLHLTLARMEDQFETIETVDRTTFAERDCFKLRVVDEPAAEGEEPTEGFVFFDVETDLFAGMEMNEKTPMGPMTVVLTVHDWEEIAGVKFFRKLVAEQMGMKMEMTYSAIEVNSVDAKVFELPEEVKQMAEEKKAEPATQPDKEIGDG